jgi:hypothetical protein
VLFRSNSFQGNFPYKNEVSDGFIGSAPVKSFPANDYGLYDMSGNVWEWCADKYNNLYYDSFKKVKVSINPKGPIKSYDPDEPLVEKRVMRGGSFLCNESYCSGYRVSARMKIQCNRPEYKLMLSERMKKLHTGKKMLNDLVDKSPARGMAFTYSGGFRCVASETQIKNLNDFKGIKFAASRNPITIDMIESLGAIPEIFTIRDYANKDKIEGLKSVALDTTIPRYLAQLQGANKNFLTNTKHSLFLTSIIIGNKFWDKLSADEQVAFQEASLYASRLERKWSVEDAENFAIKGDHSDIGVSYSEFDQEETEKFKALVEPLYSKYREFFYPGLIDGIIQS